MSDVTKNKPDNNGLGTVQAMAGFGLGVMAIGAVTEAAGGAAGVVQNFFDGQPPNIVGTAGGGALPAAMQNSIAGPAAQLAPKIPSALPTMAPGLDF